MTTSEDLEFLRYYNPGAYRQMLEIEQTAKTNWRCNGSAAAQRYLTLMLAQPNTCVNAGRRAREHRGEDKSKRAGKGAAICKVESLFLAPDAIYSFSDVIKRTRLNRSTLSNVLWRMRQRGLVCYAHGSKRLTPIYCHPQHPKSIGSRLK